MRKILLTTMIVLFVSKIEAQVNSDSLYFIQTMNQAEKIFSRQSYDSAIFLYQKAYDWATEKKLTNYYSASKCLLALGNCYSIKNNYPKAHEYYYAALLNSRKYSNHAALKNSAIRVLFKLHAAIQEHDIVFPYPPVTDFIEQNVFFSVSKILFQKGDSAVIEINAGSYDGLLNQTNNTGDLFSIQDMDNNKGGIYCGSVKIKSSTPNKTLATVFLQDKNDTIKIGWQVKLLVNVPEIIAHSTFSDIYRLNFNWKNSKGKLDIFNRRFLYYFGDEFLSKDIMDLFREEIKIVVDKWAPDTINLNSKFRQPIDEGVFKGKNIMTALHESTAETINYYIHFMAHAYTTFFGQQYNFSDSYATWVINRSPMNEKDIHYFILGNEKKTTEMTQRASLMMNQIEKGNLTSSWIDEGLELVDKNYWRSLLSQSRLLYNYGIASNRKDCIAWCNFFDAVRLRANGHTNMSDSLLTVSYQNFKEAGSAEGMEWIQSAKSVIVDSGVVHMEVPRQHTGEYFVYPSPNQRYFATASDDFTIKIWDIILGKQIHTIGDHTAGVYDLAYNPGGRYLASISYDSTIKIWNTFSYELMNSFKPKISQLSIQFSPNGNYLVSSGYDSTINFWDPFTGKLIKSFRSPGGYVQSFSFHPENTSLLYLVCTDSAIYSYNTETILISRILKSYKQPYLTFFFSNDGQHACYYQQDSTFCIVNMSNGYNEYRGKVFSWQSRGSLFFSDGAFSPDSKFFIFCRSDSNTVIVNLNQQKAVPLYGITVEQFAFNSNGNYFIRHSALAPSIVDFSAFDFQKIYDSTYGNVKFSNWKETYYLLKEKEFSSASRALFETRFSADNKSLYYLSWGWHKLDLSNGKTESISPYCIWMSGMHQYPRDENLLICKNPGADDTLNIYNVKDRKIFALLTLPEEEKISSFLFFNNDKYCMLSGEKGSIACWDVRLQKMQYFKKNITKNESRLNSLLAVPQTNRIIAFGRDSKPLIIDIANGNVVDSINIVHTNLAVITNNRLFFAADSGRLFCTDLMKGKTELVYTFRSENNYFVDMKSSVNGNYLYVLSGSTCYVMETVSLHVVNHFPLNEKNLINLSVSPNDSLLCAVSVNGEFSLYKAVTGKRVNTIYFPNANEAILTDTDGHYMASKSILNSVVFSQGYKFFNYEQFDLQLNQPHKVLSAIGFADSNTLHAYENAYLKRLKRNGTKFQTVATQDAPSIIILNRDDLRPATNKEFYNITAECYDHKFKIASIKVFVNNVPFNDSSGTWASPDTAQAVFSIKIPLIAGDNKIKIFCINEAGVSSFKEVFDVFCTAKEQKQTTWFIGLGVNRYLDSSNNLTYSVKDIRDMARSFKKLYPDIIIDTLMNKQVTIKNIELLKRRLTKIKVTDRVIMAVTGHGLLSDSLDFYYATYDIDFKNPSLKGLKYEDLENILNNTTARQRLLLIDACHSGMLEKETIYKNDIKLNNDTTGVNVKIKNARGFIMNHTQKLSDANSFNLMQNLFADFSNDNGIIVISAAGGLEYAFESERWHNGVFTYCILKGLIEKEADMEKYGGNDDGQVSVQELMRYVSFRVPSLTAGKQQPTSRRENIDFDWILN